MECRFPRAFFLAAVIAASVVLGAAPVPAGGLDGHVVITAPGLEVYFPPALHGPAEGLSASYPEIKAAAEEVLGWDMDRLVSIVLVGKSSFFEMSAGTSHIVAYAVPGRNLIVVDYQKLQSHPFTLRSVVMHELLHLLLHRHIPADSLPRWLEEGVCQWASDGLGEIVAGGEGALDRAVIRGRLPPLGSLEHSFPRGPTAMSLAYEQSKGFVTYLVRNYGRESLIEILHSMKAERDFAAAAQEVLGKSAFQLEQDWRDSLSGPAAWLGFLARHIYGWLFALAALLAIAGFVRAILKKRKALREYEEEG